MFFNENFYNSEAISANIERLCCELDIGSKLLEQTTFE
jgi:hypothetical protein